MGVRWKFDSQLLAHILENCTPVPITGCLLWTRDAASQYGQIRVDGKAMGVHRAMYILSHGQPPSGYHIDHLCRVRICCNPDHLEAVTLGENVLRGNGISAVNARKTHCKNGHELTIDNLEPTHLRLRGTRNCKVCIRARERKNRAAKRRQQKFTGGPT